MKVAFCVEGNTDRAIIHGLRERWCPTADLMEGRFRGQLPRSQISKECKILTQKGADLIIFLRDSNLEQWRDVLRADEAKCPPEFRHKVVFGVCDRNAECWLTEAADHLASTLGLSRSELDMEDPSPIVKRAFGLTGFDKQEQEVRVVNYVKVAPLSAWLRNRSFENFYEQLWHQSQQNGCRVENLRERR